MTEQFDYDEIPCVSDKVGDIIAPNGQPWEMPNFSLEDARAIGQIAADTLASGEWDRIEARIRSDLEARRNQQTQG